MGKWAGLGWVGSAGSFALSIQYSNACMSHDLFEYTYTCSMFVADYKSKELRVYEWKLIFVWGMGMSMSMRMSMDMTVGMSMSRCMINFQ